MAMCSDHGMVFLTAFPLFLEGLKFSSTGAKIDHFLRLPVGFEARLIILWSPPELNHVIERVLDHS
jgi:hypothetical protein